MSRRVRGAGGLACAFAIACGLSPTAAAAQPGDDGASAAQQAFDRGMAAAREGRWDVALESFRRAHAARPDDRLLINVAGALVRLGRLVEAEATYEAFLARAEGPEMEPFRAAAESGLDDLAPRIATVTVSATGLAPGDAVVVDGEVVDDGELGAPLRVDPGPHRAEVRRGGATVASDDVAVDEGGSATLWLMAPAAASATNPEEDEAPPDLLGAGEGAGPNDAAGPAPLWPWIAGGVGVVAGVVLVVVLVASASAPAEFEGNLVPGQLRVR